MRSNITPTDNEITVKAEIANIMGGIIWPNTHLSSKGSKYQGEIILLIVFLISDWFESFKEIYLIYTVFQNIINYQWFRKQYKFNS